MPATDTERLAVLIEANTRSYERAMARIEGRTNQTMARASRSVKTLDAQMKATALTATRFMAAFGVTLGIGGITRLIGQLDELGKQAKRTGVDVESLQALLRGAKLSGASEGTLERGLQALNEEIAKASTGATDFGRLLAANNISLRDANGELRSTKELFLDVADLVANATNHIEGQRVASLAMNRAGRELLPYLQQGADALRKQEQAARDAGLVINADLIKAAEGFNDAWADAWLLFRGNAFNAISAVATQLQGLRDIINDILRSTPEARLQGLLNRGIPRDVAERLMAGGGTPLEGLVTRPRGPATLVPGTPGRGSSRATDELERQRAAVRALIADLEHEYRLMGLSEVQRQVENALRQAGAAATDEQRRKIEELIRAMYEAERAQDEAIRKLDEQREVARGFAHDVRTGFMSGASAAETFSRALDNVAARLSSMATNQLLDLLLGKQGSAGTGLVGSLFGGLFPGRAIGGPVTAGRPYMVGERGPELFIPKASGQIVANDNIGGVTVAPVYQIDARGSDISESRFRAILEQNNQQLRSQVVPMIREAQSRRVL